MTARDLEGLSAALTRQRRLLGISHKLDLSGPIQFDERLGLSRVGVQKQLQELDLSRTSLTSLHTLQRQPNLRVLRADESRIEVLTGIDRHTSLSVLSLEGTPVAASENFRIAALIISPKLSEINGEKVTHAERRIALSYPPIAKALIGAGWIVQYPPPSEMDFRFIARTFDLKADDKDFVVPVALPIPAAKPSPPASPPRAAGFADRIAGLLGELGFPIRSGDRMEEDIVEAVGILCRVVTKIESLSAKDDTNETSP